MSEATPLDLPEPGRQAHADPYSIPLDEIDVSDFELPDLAIPQLELPILIPPIPLTFAGAKITGIHPLGPIYDGLLLNVTALGGIDSVDIGLVVCRKGVPEVWEISEAIDASLAELALALESRTERGVPQDEMRG